MKFQNPSLIFFERMDGRTHRPKAICSPLFQSLVIKSVKNMCIQLNSFIPVSFSVMISKHVFNIYFRQHKLLF